VPVRTDEHLVVATVSQRQHLGLDHWVDGTFGVVRTERGTLAIAPNGRHPARHALDRGGFLDGLCEARSPIAGLPAWVHHASGGPVVLDEATGDLLLVYHGEHFHDGDPTDYWSFLGIAHSTDDGRRWVDCGAIITPALARTAPVRPRSVEVGSGAFTIADGWMNVFFQERGPGNIMLNLGVARARIDEVWHAARSREPLPAFSKHHGGSWTGSGLGGPASELLPDLGSWPVMWFDVNRFGDKGTALVYSSVGRSSEGTWGWKTFVSFAADGLAFPLPTPLTAEASPEELLYLTIDAPGSRPRSIDHGWFHLYRVRSSTRFRWDDAQLERMTVYVEE
jgi:hypothetical protein